MAITHLYKYEVTGNGIFPWDMLRYDCCWPASSEDAFNLEKPTDPEKRVKPRTVRMSSIQAPTEGRWTSFLWRVEHVTKWKI